MEIQVGHDIGNYHILAVIAQGAYSNVYKAAHVILTNRIVAVKILHTPFTEGGKSEDVFYQEARILEQIKHSYILPVLDVSVYQNLPYIVKEFAPHGSLLDRIHKLHGRPMPLGDALPVLKQVGEGLQYVHDHRIVHCDLKPANILFSEQKEALIADFDIARVLHAVNSSSPAIGGTPSYMSPEHFQGKVRCASDQYALGCMTYELLTGKRPFEGHDYEELKRQHLYEAPASLTQHNPHLPPQVEQAVLRSMAKKYEDRYPNIAAFIDALQSVSGEPVISSAQQQTQPAGPVPVHKASAASRKKHSTEEHLILKPTKGATPVDDDIYYEATVVGNELVLGAGDQSHRRASASIYEARTLPAAKASAKKKTTTGEAKTEEKSAPKKKTDQAKAAPAKKTTKAVKADIHTAPTQKEKADAHASVKTSRKTEAGSSGESATAKKASRTGSASKNTTAKKVARTVSSDKPAPVKKRTRKVASDDE